MQPENQTNHAATGPLRCTKGPPCSNRIIQVQQEMQTENQTTHASTGPLRNTKWCNLRIKPPMHQQDHSGTLSEATWESNQPCSNRTTHVHQGTTMQQQDHSGTPSNATWESNHPCINRTTQVHKVMQPENQTNHAATGPLRCTKGPPCSNRTIQVQQEMHTKNQTTHTSTGPLRYTKWCNLRIKPPMHQLDYSGTPSDAIWESNHPSTNRTTQVHQVMQPENQTNHAATGPLRCTKWCSLRIKPPMQQQDHPGAPSDAAWESNHPCSNRTT